MSCGSYTYTGDWVDDAMHGQGRFTFAIGASYQGWFEHNKFSGQGTYTFPDGKQYTVGTRQQWRWCGWVQGRVTLLARVTLWVTGSVPGTE